MKDKLKAAFDQVQAEEALKEKTRAYLADHAQNRTPARKHPVARRLVPAAACLVLVLLGGNWLYFTPTATISVDINPSLELAVNRFDKVLSVDGYNQDGQALADTLDCTFASYTEVVDAILADEQVAALLSDNGVLTITVVGDNETQSARLLSGVESCTAGQKNAYCYCAHGEEMEHAHQAGLSYGKYQAYLELQALDPTVTPEQVQGMTMREIRERISTLSGASSGSETSTSSGSAHHSQTENEHGHNGRHQGND